MRFRHLAPFSTPHKALEEKEVMGYKIKAGTTIMACIGHVMRDEDMYPEARKSSLKDLLTRMGSLS